MNSNYVTSGSLILTKDYNKFKKFLYKLIGKELPYNALNIVYCNTLLLTPDNLEIKILEPIKPYSKLESTMLKVALEKWYKLQGPISHLIINVIRPETVKSDESLNDLLNNKYYRVK